MQHLAAKFQIHFAHLIAVEHLVLLHALHVVFQQTEHIVKCLTRRTALHAHHRHHSAQQQNNIEIYMKMLILFVKIALQLLCINIRMFSPLTWIGSCRVPHPPARGACTALRSICPRLPPATASPARHSRLQTERGGKKGKENEKYEAQLEVRATERSTH